MDTQNGLIIGYSVSLIADDDVILRKEIKEREIEFRTLNPFTVYFFTVAAVTSAGTGPDSQPYSFLTHEDGKFNFHITMSCISISIQFPVAHLLT